MKKNKKRWKRHLQRLKNGTNDQTQIRNTKEDEKVIIKDDTTYVEASEEDTKKIIQEWVAGDKVLDTQNAYTLDEIFNIAERPGTVIVGCYIKDYVKNMLLARGLKHYKHDSKLPRCLSITRENEMYHFLRVSERFYVVVKSSELL